MHRPPAPTRLTAPEALAFLAAALLSFAWLATDLVRMGPITRADANIMAWVHAHSRETLTQLMVVVTNLHSYTGVCLMAAAAAGWLVWRKRMAWLPFLIVSVPGGLILNALVKFEFHRSRPVMESPLPALHTYSFPSGHTAGATLWWGFVLTLLFAWRAPLRWRVTGVALAVCMVAFTAVSRVYLGVHYPSDVLAAIAEGSAWLMFCHVLLGRQATVRQSGATQAVAEPARATPTSPVRTSPQGSASIEVIANSTSGPDSAPGWADELESKLREQGLEAHVTHVNNGNEILAAAKDAAARGVQLVVAAGGDGTVSAVASQLAGTTSKLGVLPMGTLNHFAKDLGIPLELDAALRVLATGHTVSVDAAEVNGRIFINNSSLGLYPDIVLDRERQRRRLGRGKWGALLAASLHAAQRYPVLTFDMEIDGKPISRRSAFAFIGNNEYTMEGFEIGGRAQGLSDGQLSLYITQRTGRFGLLRLALRALFHRLRQAKDFDIITAQSLVVNTRHRHMRVATDGEVTLMETPLTYRIRPAALRVIVPAPQEQGDTK